jgi:hypothetical protein
VAFALALGLDRTAHVLSTGDLVDRVYWSSRVNRAAEMLKAARSQK